VIYPQFELRCDGGPGPYDCEPALYENTLARVEASARSLGWVKKGRRHFCPDHKGGGSTPNPGGEQP
jgi:hypothetical protein